MKIKTYTVEELLNKAVEIIQCLKSSLVLIDVKQIIAQNLSVENNAKSEMGQKLPMLVMKEKHCKFIKKP